MARKTPKPRASGDILGDIIHLGVQFAEAKVRESLSLHVPASVAGPTPTGPIIPDPYEVLGVRRTDPIEMIEDVYTTKAKYLHPDMGAAGSVRAMQELNAAIAEIRAQRGKK